MEQEWLFFFSSIDFIELYTLLCSPLFLSSLSSLSLSSLFSLCSSQGASDLGRWGITLGKPNLLKSYLQPETYTGVGPRQPMVPELTLALLVRDISKICGVSLSALISCISVSLASLLQGGSIHFMMLSLVRVCWYSINPVDYTWGGETIQNKQSISCAYMLSYLESERIDSFRHYAVQMCPQSI